MRTKYVCFGLISPDAKFYNNPTMRTEKLLLKIFAGGGKGKRPKSKLRATLYCAELSKFVTLLLSRAEQLIHFPCSHCK